MKETTLTVSPDEKNRTFRLLAVLTFIVYPVLCYALRDTFLAQPDLYPVLTAIVTSVSLYAWYLFDSALLGVKRQFLYGILIMILSIVGVPLYLFKSRQRQQAWQALGVAVLVMLLQMVITVNTVPMQILIKNNPFIH